MNNTRTRLYIFVGLLFILTFLFFARIFAGIKTHQLDYFRLIANAVLLAYVIYQIVKLGKIENNKKG